MVRPWVMLVALLGCRGEGSYRCSTSAECVDQEQGFCESTGFCSFLDSSCESGRRYADYSSELTGVCVEGCVFAGGELPFTPSNVACTMIPQPGPPITIDSMTILDSDLVTLTPASPAPLSSITIVQVGAPELLVVVTESLAITAAGTLVIRGGRPVAIVAIGDAIVDGRVSLGAVATANGPGAGDPVACAIGFGADGVPQVSAAGNTGGAGGAGGGYGGDGGSGARVNTSLSAPTAEGVTNGEADLSPLRGGCRGGAGGMVTGGSGGGGGGAVQIVAGGSITVGATGIVTAHGGGGVGVSGMVSGGGGGGSGGGVLLEASMISVLGAITANGGAGAEGTRGGVVSVAGEDGHVADAVPAIGGVGTSQGGNGGNGGASALAGAGFEGMSDATRGAGGGGGGGGVGRIHLRSLDVASVTGLISPPPQ